MTSRIYSKVIGCAGYLPDNKVSNFELAQRLAQNNIETSDEWIRARTGICNRHFSQTETTSDLALKAAQLALINAKLTADDINLIIVATSTPDFIFPSTACLLQQKLKMNSCTAFDVQAVCSGFVYALTVADSLIRTGAYKNVLVIGAETFSSILNFSDRATCVLFGDGAGAFVLTSSQNSGIIDCELGADGNYAGILSVPGNVRQGAVCGSPFLQMDGQAVFKFAVNVLAECALKILKRQNLTVSDINWVVPHQANIRIMKAIAKKINISEDKMISTVADHANTSAASIPLAFATAQRQGKIKSGDKVLMLGVGGGFTWGGVLLQY